MIKSNNISWYGMEYVYSSLWTISNYFFNKQIYDTFSDLGVVWRQKSVKNSVSYNCCLITPKSGLLELSGSPDSEKYRFVALKIMEYTPN